MRPMCCLAAVSLACSSARVLPDGGGLPDSGPADAGVGEPDAGDAGADGGPDAGDGGSLPACDVHASSPSMFTDQTDAWNLGDGGLSVVGNRIMAADLDGDGYPDLIISANSSVSRETIPPAELPAGMDAGPAPSDAGYPRQVFVLMNRPRPDGGRMFVDATYESGVFQVRGGSATQYRTAQLAVAGDVNNDGALDLFSGTDLDGNNPQYDVGDRSEILLNDGHGHFSLAPISDPHPSPTDLWATSGAAFTDVDRDGHLDLFVGFWYQYYGYSYLSTQAQLYRGNGDGTFTSITFDAGLATTDDGFAQGTNHRPSYGVTACDLNGDGSPELIVSAYGRQWNLLYQNDGRGNFVEVGQDAGVAGDQDLHYEDNQFFVCYCTVHPTEPDCVGVGAPEVVCPTPADANWGPGVDDQPWRLNGNNFTTVCGDLTGDGAPDLYSATIKHWYVGESADASELLASVGVDGGVLFSRRDGGATGLSVRHATTDWDEGLITAAIADLDNDGRSDLLVGATDYPNQFGLLYRQLDAGTFEEVGQAWGLHHACLSGMAVADFDRDGDLDVVVGSSLARSCSQIWKTNEVHLYENNASEHGHWLAIRLAGDGTTTNAAGIGARVTVTAGGVAQVQEVSGGYGTFGMQNDTVLFFGLGSCAAVEAVEVRWPNQALSIDRFVGVPDNQLIELRQGDPAVHPVQLHPDGGV